MKKFIRLIISIAIPLGIGGLGSVFTSNSVSSWYPTLVKPSFNPPNWIFGPVWTLLFILMGVSFYLVWNKSFGKEPKKLVGIYALQLVLNLLWSVFFFGWQNPALALGEIGVLWVAIAVNAFWFHRVSRLAGNLLIPYLLWVSFATVLNSAIVILN